MPTLDIPVPVAMYCADCTVCALHPEHRRNTYGSGSETQHNLYSLPRTEGEFVLDPDNRKRFVSTKFPNEYPANSKELQSLKFYDAEEPPPFNNNTTRPPVLHTLQGLEEGRYPNDNEVYVCDVCVTRELIASWMNLDAKERPPIDQWFTVPSLHIVKSGDAYPDVTVKLDKKNKQRMVFKLKKQGLLEPKTPPAFNPDAELHSKDLRSRVIAEVSSDTPVKVEKGVQDTNDPMEKFKLNMGAKVLAVFEAVQKNPANFEVFFEWERRDVYAYLNDRTQSTRNEWHVVYVPADPNAAWVYYALNVLSVALQTLRQIKEIHTNNTEKVDKDIKGTARKKTTQHDLEHLVNAIL
eukprot:2409955-Rhodomonas_salina.1